MKVICQICGRVLTHPDSIANGAGPVCMPRELTNPLRSSSFHRKKRRKEKKDSAQLRLREDEEYGTS